MTSPVATDRRKSSDSGQPQRTLSFPVNAIWPPDHTGGPDGYERTGELLEPMARVARMIEGHLEGILAHWTQGLTTAFMEGLNSLLSAVKRKARGYRSVEYMTTMLYFVAGKLTLPCY